MIVCVTSFANDRLCDLLQLSFRFDGSIDGMSDLSFIIESRKFSRAHLQLVSSGDDRLHEHG